MRLSCNFINVYTIVYHVQYTYTCTRAHLRVCRTNVRGQVGELNGRPKPRRGAHRVPREDPRAVVGEEVRVAVGVGVRVSPVEFKL